MKTRRRGYALIELLVMITAVALLMALSVQPARTALAEVPRMDRHYQSWIRTMDLLDMLRQDIETASAIRLTEQTDPNSTVLRLATSDGPVDYELAGERVIRRKDGQPEQDATEWNLPAGRLRLNTWSGESGTYAVEVTTWGEHKAGGRVRKHYEQTHVFFRKAP